MKFGFIIMLAIAATLIFQSQIYSFPYIYEEGGVQFELPEDWSVEDTLDDGYLYFHTPGEEFSIVVTSVEAKSLDKALDFLSRDLTEEYDNFTIKNKHRNKINGFDTIILDGKLAADQTGFNVIKVLLAKAPTGKIILAYCIDSAEAVHHYEEAVNNILKGIKQPYD